MKEILCGEFFQYDAAPIFIEKARNFFFLQAVGQFLISAIFTIFADFVNLVKCQKFFKVFVIFSNEKNWIHGTFYI